MQHFFLLTSSVLHSDFRTAAVAVSPPSFPDPGIAALWIFVAHLCIIPTMERAIAKARVLIESLPYIHAFKGRVVVIKYGGSTLGDDNPDVNILRDIAFLYAVGMRPIVVHGGGKLISQRLKEQGIESTFVQGLRVTSAEAVRIVEDVLVNEINAALTATLERLECPATGMSGAGNGMVRVERLTGTDERGEPLDWGYVGRVTRINPRPLFDELLARRVPVVAPLGVGPDSMTYNINADTVAAEIAASLTAEKLVYLTDVPGICRDPKDPHSLLSTVHLNEVPRLIEEGVITGGMLPKINGCIAALNNDVHKTHIISGRIPHSLLLELFTDTGVGTEIIR